MGKKNGRQILEAFGMVTSLGLTMVSTVAAGLLLGRWLDNRFDSTPWATVSGIVLGMAAGLWSVYKRVLQK